MIRYAVFDLDETITARGTWGRFVNLSVRRRPWRFFGIWGRAALGQLLYKTTSLERVSVKRGMLRWSLTGQSRERLHALAEDFAAQEVATGLRPGALRAITAHRAAGDTIIIASAAADLVANAIAEKLDITHVVATKLAWDNGVCADDFASENCYGAGKLTALRTYLETFPDYRREVVHITLYTDSYSDLPVLEFADKGVAVNADAKLQAASPVYGFETVDWSQ